MSELEVSSSFQVNYINHTTSSFEWELEFDEDSINHPITPINTPEPSDQLYDFYTYQVLDDFDLSFFGPDQFNYEVQRPISPIDPIDQNDQSLDELDSNFNFEDEFDGSTSTQLPSSPSTD